MKKMLIAFIALCFISTSISVNAADNNMSQQNPWEQAYYDKINQLYEESDSNDTYAIYDIDGDGTPELLDGWRIMGVYTFKNGKVTYLGDIYNEPYKLSGEKGIYTFGGFGTGVGGSTYYTLDRSAIAEGKGNIELSYGTELGGEGNLSYRSNSKAVTEEEYNNLVAKYFNNKTTIPLMSAKTVQGNPQLSNETVSTGDGYEVILPFQFDDETTEYSQNDFGTSGFASVSKDGKWGIVDSYGKLIVPCEYDPIDAFTSNGLIRVSKDWKYGFVDQTGKLVIDCQYENAKPYKNSLAAVRKDGKWGFIDKKGELVINYQFNDTNGFTANGLACVSMGKKWGVINRQGKLVADCIYDLVFDFDKRGLTMVVKDGLWGYIDEKGTLVIPCRFNDASRFGDESLAVVSIKENNVIRYGYVDKTGKIVIPCTFESASEFSSDFAIVQKNGKNGFIDATGKIIIPCEYDEVNSFAHNGLATVKKRKCVGLYRQRKQNIYTISI